MTAMKLILLSCLLGLAGCSGDDDSGTCPHGPITVKNANGKLHSELCDQDSECRYGYCYKSPSVTKGQFGICTKPCDCGEGSLCSDDGEAYTCARFSPSQEPMVSFCVRECDADAECPAPYTGCTNLVGVRKFCVAQ